MGRTFRRRRKRPNLAPSLEHDSSIIKLKQFMVTQGFDWRHKFKHLKLRDFKDTGRGVFSAQKIRENDVLVEVPYDLMITFSTILNPSSEIATLLLNGTKVKLTIHDLLSLFLVVEKHRKSASKWADYINSLPSEPPWLPWWPVCEISREERDLKIACDKARTLFEESWSRVEKSITGYLLPCDININTYAWGYILVNTRAVYVNPTIVLSRCHNIRSSTIQDEPSMALCPFLDMFNHNYDVVETQARFIENKGTLCYQLINSNTTKSPQNQIFISYGPHDNIKLLVEYGFFIPGNINDCVKFSLDEVFQIMALHLNYHKLKKTIHQHNFATNLYISESHGVSFNLKAILYLIRVDNNNSSHNGIDTIFSDSYPPDFDGIFNEMCRKLLLDYYQRVSGVHSGSSVTDDFVKYRVNYVEKLLLNYQ